MKKTCKRRLCNKKFIPKKRRDQVFCSKRCCDTQGKEDWKRRNKKKYQISENIRKKKKYHSDTKHAEKLKLKTLKRYHALTDDEKFIHNKRKRLRENPIKKRNYFKNYQNKRNKEDVNHRLAGSLRARLRAAIKKNRTVKSFRTMELVGCTIDELKQHLESKFKKGMSWNNYGKWHVDHVVPVDFFDLTKIEEQKKCFHYLNLQPLLARDNLRKRNRI
jgi:hypothetical protein